MPPSTKSPSNVAQTLAQAVQLHRQGRLADAERLYREILEVQPDQIDALNNRGAALLSLQRNEEALASFRQALRVKPDHVEAHYNCGSALRNLGRYERALAIDPEFAEARGNLVRVLCLLDRFEEALTSLTQALARDPNDARSYFERGRVYSTSTATTRRRRIS